MTQSRPETAKQQTSDGDRLAVNATVAAETLHCIHIFLFVTVSPVHNRLFECSGGPGENSSLSK